MKVLVTFNASLHSNNDHWNNSNEFIQFVPLPQVCIVKLENIVSTGIYL